MNYSKVRQMFSFGMKTFAVMLVFVIGMYATAHLISSEYSKKQKPVLTPKSDTFHRVPPKPINQNVVMGEEDGMEDGLGDGMEDVVQEYRGMEFQTVEITPVNAGFSLRSPAPQKRRRIVHVVQPKENMYKISERYMTHPKILQKENPNVVKRNTVNELNPSFLKSGDQLHVSLPVVPRFSINEYIDDAKVWAVKTGRYPAMRNGRKYDKIVQAAASTYGVDPVWIRSLMSVESNFNPSATSNSGAAGLMQLLPSTAKEVGVKNIFDPVQNIHGGTRHFRNLLKRFHGNVDLALIAYNYGAKNVIYAVQGQRWDKLVPYYEYLARIKHMATYQRFSV